MNETSNFGHSTYHAMITRVEKRFSSGLSYNVLFTWSKNIAGSAGGDPNVDGGGSYSGASQFYNWNLTKAVTSNDQRLQFTSQLAYELPFGRGRKYANNNRIADAVIGGWQFLTIQSIRSGLPVQFKLAGSPNRYLPGQGNAPNVVAGQNINVSDYSIGTNVFPQAAQNPFYNINAFSNPAAFTQGNAGYGIARTGAVWWPQYSLTKTWTYREKYKLTVRMDANNLFPETRWLNTANSTVNFSSPQLFGKFPGTTGYSFSNFYGQNGTLQGGLRIAF